MKCLLAIALITTFLLAFFSHSGSALVCYNCQSSPCNTNQTCSSDQNACMVAYLGSRNVSACWKYSQCELDYIGKQFKVDSFKFRCCQMDLCNGSPIPVASKIVMIIASLVTVIKLVSF
ncbi:CD59 glycoprotein [Anolis sagrei]|uniref:CD59 glycoprotein n=1 Tax=Anolis sagrei TaxID=38937 RepID=UPI003522E31D